MTAKMKAEQVESEKFEKFSFKRVLTGTALYSVFSWIYDFPVYSWVIWKLGPLYGGLSMALLSVPLDLFTLKFYDWSQQDWFAIEYLKSIKNYEGSNIVKKFLRWVLTSTPTPVQVFFLSFKFNSFVVTVLLRDGAYSYAPLTRRDWKIFWGSFLVGQAYWIVTISTGVEAGEWLYSLFAY